MKKKIVAMGVSLAVMVFNLVGCTGSAEAEKPKAETNASSEDKTVEENASVEDAVLLKVNLTQNTSDPWYEWWTDWAKRVEEASEGTLKLELYTSQSLGPSAEILQANENGASFIAVSDFIGLSDYCADAAIYQAPYLLEKPEQLYELWQSEVGKNIDAELAKSKIHVIAPVYYGTRNVLANKPATNRKEMGSLKLRVNTQKMWMFVAETLGANPTGMPWSEIYQALSQKIADGCESPSSSLYTDKFYEVCKYLILTEHQIGNSVMSMSEDVWQSLPEKAQTALETISKEFSQETVGLVNGITEEFDKKLQDEGVTFIEFDREEAKEYSRANIEEEFPEWTDGLYEKAIEVLSKD